MTWGRDWRIIGWKKNFDEKSLLLLQSSVFVTAIGVDARRHEESVEKLGGPDQGGPDSMG